MGGPAIRDILGRTFGRATVVKFHAIVTHKAHWLCRCSCGTEWTTSGTCLIRGLVQSCGCWQRKRAGDANRVHGMSNKARTSYINWLRMRIRCYNANTKEYKNYGGRGIRVCSRWDDFANFYADMGDRPFRGATIERLDNNKDYGPDNCAWRDRKAQGNNKRNNRLLTSQGVTMTLSQWADARGIQRGTIFLRIKRGRWSIDQALGFEDPPFDPRAHKSYASSRTYKPFNPSEYKP
jgi:hypothetical protein